MGLKFLKPLNYPSVIVSSRTDSGVHALNTTVHVDLERKNGDPYDPVAILLHLNKYFHKHDLPIRILRTHLVPDSFHCRTNAISRTYLYRLCIVKADFLHVANHLHHLPIEENRRCLFLCTNTFDVEAFKQTTNLFLGLHDFRTFMGKASKQPDKITRRTLDRLTINEVHNSCYSKYSWPLGSDVLDYKFYDITCTSRGFLYNQVRRTVAALIAVAQGKVTTRDIKFMLEVPSHESWNSRIKTVPAHGLYLCEVVYPECDIQTFKATI